MVPVFLSNSGATTALHVKAAVVVVLFVNVDEVVNVSVPSMYKRYT
jgi:hypothetical protein